MTDTSAFAALSHAIAATARTGAAAVAGLEWGGHHHISGLLWRPGVRPGSGRSLPANHDIHASQLRGKVGVSQQRPNHGRFQLPQCALIDRDAGSARQS